MKMTNCVCGHEKRDHKATLTGGRFGACKVCLCDAYSKPAALAPETANGRSLATTKALAGSSVRPEGSFNEELSETPIRLHPQRG